MLSRCFYSLLLSPCSTGYLVILVATPFKAWVGVVRKTTLVKVFG
ncbi:hypothetical protein M2448_002029 [Dysgonomonas sp. PF1-14]|nr:hypothetical protein [Dysgonomonas sp. PF1-14]MDH6339026.1 hypothetical protein [Dysgonomonas sp. PF1-16]MDH6397854.1 hypothetical protein [Dysgonomonas sp. PF1-23]